MRMTSRITLAALLLSGLTCSFAQPFPASPGALGVTITSPYPGEEVATPLSVTGTCLSDGPVTISAAGTPVKTRCAYGAFLADVVFSGPAGPRHLTVSQPGTPSALLDVRYAGAAAIKSPLHGILAMGNAGGINVKGIDATNLEDYAGLPAGLVNGVMINATWRQLEPERGTYNTAVIDEALTAIRGYNQRNPLTPWAARLRVFMGSSAPAWAKQIDGGPLSLNKRGQPKSVGYFWHDNYIEAVAQLETYLASKYDKEPLVREVDDSTCASVSDEAMNLPHDPQDIKVLTAAHFDDQAFHDCLVKSFAGYDAWKTTRVDVAFNEWRSVENGAYSVKPGLTEALMAEFRKRYGLRAVLHNHSLGADDQGHPLVPAVHILPVYQQMKDLGPTAELQQSGPRDTNLNGAIPQAASFGVTAVEVWNLSIAALPDKTQLLRWSSLLERNPTP
jgi:hypothetical protein